MIEDSTLCLESTKLAITLAKDLSVQLITIATTVTGVTIIFAKDLRKSYTFIDVILLFVIWSLYTISIIFGILSVMALTGYLAPVEGSPQFGIGSSARTLATFQIILFGIATMLFLIYGTKTLLTLHRQP